MKWIKDHCCLRMFETWQVKGWDQFSLANCVLLGYHHPLRCFELYHVFAMTFLSIYLCEIWGCRQLLAFINFIFASVVEYNLSPSEPSISCTYVRKVVVNFFLIHIPSFLGLIPTLILFKAYAILICYFVNQRKLFSFLLGVSSLIAKIYYLVNWTKLFSFLLGLSSIIARIEKL